MRSFDELRKVKLWQWDIDEMGIANARAVGLSVVPLPIYEAARAFDEKRIDVSAQLRADFFAAASRARVEVATGSSRRS